MYDVGPNYLVMELCEGETLAARLKRGKLSVAETLRYGAQVADALSAAHAKGIVHRDLKPHNVMLGKSGIKVLDFGLAKSPQDETLTASQAVMGTPAYMAPEQREEKECDARTDIYSLGLVLFEMVTGKRADQGQMPSMNQIPEKLARLIERCLASDPEHRWHSATDLMLELEWVDESQPTATTVSTQAAQSRTRRAWPTVFSAVLAIFIRVRQQIRIAEVLANGGEHIERPVTREQLAGCRPQAPFGLDPEVGSSLAERSADDRRWLDCGNTPGPWPADSVQTRRAPR